MHPLDVLFHNTKFLAINAGPWCGHGGPHSANLTAAVRESCALQQKYGVF